MKNIIRTKVLSKRDNLEKEERSQKSSLIHSNLFKLEEFQKAKTILFYVSFKSEVQTEKMIMEALQLGKKVFVPIANYRDKTLELSELKDLVELEKSKLGIPEPKQEHRKICQTDPDLVIIPGIAFDSKGTRIGYGDGYYDKFLSKIRQEIPFIGLAYDEQMVDEIPKEEHDVPVNKIITENKVIECE